jgi:hypothetical protein
MAAKKSTDPTVRSTTAPEYPEGTHPPASPSEQAWGPYRFSYSDVPADEKPDESTVAQTVESDPLRDAVDQALSDESGKDSSK